MVQHMSAAGSVPHFHFHDDVRMERLTYLRSDLRTEAQARGIRLTVLPFIIKVNDGDTLACKLTDAQHWLAESEAQTFCRPHQLMLVTQSKEYCRRCIVTCTITSFCIAVQALCRVLAQFPDVNASLQTDRRAIIRHRDHNIGVAMATHTGLVVRPSTVASSVIGAQHWGCRSCTHRPCGKMPAPSLSSQGSSHRLAIAQPTACSTTPCAQSQRIGICLESISKMLRGMG